MQKLTELQQLRLKEANLKIQIHNQQVLLLRESGAKLSNNYKVIEEKVCNEYGKTRNDIETIDIEKGVIKFKEEKKEEGEKSDDIKK